MIYNLLEDAILLLALCWLQTLNVRLLGDCIAGKLLSAVLFGGICVLGMLSSVSLMDGVILDPRTVILSVSALFSGPLVAILAGLIAAAGRAWIGGTGMWAGLAEITLAVALGLIYRGFNLRRKITTGPLQLLAFGYVVHILDLLVYVPLPRHHAESVLEMIWLPQLLVMPLATLGLGWMLKDLAQRANDERELKIAATAFNSQSGMIITDERNIILRVNEAFCEITGFSRDDVIGNNTRMLSSGRHAPAFYKAMWMQISEHGSWHGEIWNRRKNGEVFPEWLSISAVHNDKGKIINYVASFADISERKAAQEHIEKLAFYDSLTGLPNKRMLADRIDHAMTFGERSGEYLALLLLDLDNFKIINDLHGYAVGDQLLSAVAGRIINVTRNSDTTARLGGDEFVIMLEGLSNIAEEAAAQAEQVAETIRESLLQPYQIDLLTLHCSASIGVVLCNGSSDTQAELIKRAELSMYTAKAAGRNSVSFFDPHMQDAVDSRWQLEEEIREGLVTDRFVMYLQPQVDETGAITGAEALARWDHPQHGILSPQAFIEAAEQAGLIDALDCQMLEKTCHTLAAWQQQPETQMLELSVNVSARFLYRADFLRSVLWVLEQSGADPTRLKLELTESLLLDDLPQAILIMSQLRKLGIRFSIDDFGTGYSSLAYLQRLPLDQLKIDQSFVKALETDDNSAEIIRAICALADSLKLQAIAEGVETVQQRDSLIGLGCYHFQGYLHGRPMPLADFEALVMRDAQVIKLN